MSNSPPESAPGGLVDRLRRPVQVIVVSSVMFTFISYWRTAAVVLADLASTAYYIGGIVENAIGPAAPWFILAVMLFSYAVRSVYIESCSLFVRGGVYRVVKEAMGGFLAKLSVSALMFDYILTGPVSAVSAGLYIVGLLLDSLVFISPALRVDPGTADYIRRWGSVVIACVIILYFFRQNLLGIRESSEKALKIMIVTTIVAARAVGVELPHLGRSRPGQPRALEARSSPQGGVCNRHRKRPGDGRRYGGLEKGPADRSTCGQDGARPGRPSPARAAAERSHRASGRSAGVHQPLVAGVRQEIARAGQLVEPHRHDRPDAGVRPLDSGDERRGDAGPGLPRGGIAETAELQEGGVHHLSLQPPADGQRFVPRRAADSRPGPHEGIRGQPHRRVGDERPRAAAGAAVPQRPGRDGGLPDSLRRGEHGDHRLQRRAEPRGRGRRDARLVPQAPPPLRDHLPRALSDRGLAVGGHHPQPRQHVYPRRGLRFRHRVELRLQGHGDGRAPFQGPQPAGVQGAAERPHPRRRGADRAVDDLPDPDCRRPC